MPNCFPEWFRKFLITATLYENVCITILWASSSLFTFKVKSRHPTLSYMCLLTSRFEHFHTQLIVIIQGSYLSPLILVNLAKLLSILLSFPKTQILISSIFSTVFIYIIYFCFDLCYLLSANFGFSLFFVFLFLEV